MNVVINGRAHQVPEEVTVAAVLAELDVPVQGVAVAVDGHVVPKAQWASTTLRPDITVEVLTAVQGG